MEGKGILRGASSPVSGLRRRRFGQYLGLYHGSERRRDDSAEVYEQIAGTMREARVATRNPWPPASGIATGYPILSVSRLYDFLSLCRRRFVRNRAHRRRPS